MMPPEWFILIILHSFSGNLVRVGAGMTVNAGVDAGMGVDGEQPVIKKTTANSIKIRGIFISFMRSVRFHKIVHAFDSS
jgi:hypothetical protein